MSVFLDALRSLFSAQPKPRELYLSDLIRPKIVAMLRERPHTLDELAAGCFSDPHLLNRVEVVCVLRELGAERDGDTYRLRP